jgi:hypothetical protein
LAAAFCARTEARYGGFSLSGRLAQAQSLASVDRGVAETRAPKPCEAAATDDHQVDAARIAGLDHAANTLMASPDYHAHAMRRDGL